MVAYVYDNRGEVLKLNGKRECVVSEYSVDGYNSYSSEIMIGTGHNYILLRGRVVHNIVRNVIHGESLRTKRAMREYIDRIIKEEEDNK